ncbi:hypothetical protein [Flavobacterium sp. '19STA2R22 D10 B1']|uniref:hypothetical protein n=1 Tax=Flavobacterium aerium TaxID=3037261 RepID=UPI00278BCF35|nr:hypothetical protein [Flavobacterium sp. '19STA2R22 D10 B1']
MKRISTLLFLFSFYLTCYAQDIHLKINGKTEVETSIIDSIGYNKIHPNTKSITDNINLVSASLTKNGFLEHYIEGNKKINDSTFVFNFSLGNKTTIAHIYIGKASEIKALNHIEDKKDTITLAFSKIESFLDETLHKLEVKGYSLAKLKLINIQQKNNTVYADLDLNLQKLRQLNDIVIVGYDKFPAGHKKNVKRFYKNKIFNQENLKRLHSDFEKFRFVNQIKYPEILFTEDSTKVYVYLEKSKPNRFDGFIGFSNNEEGNVIFNGYLDLLLNNALNVGEKFTLYWKSDGNGQKTFNTAIELPYIFRSPLGLKAQLNIFKQDSTFQNTQTAIDLGYFFDYNTRLYLGYQSTESNDIQNKNNYSISDYKNSFTTSTFEFVTYNNEDILFPEKTSIILKGGFGKRTSNLNTNNQFFVNLSTKNNFYLNDKNIINIKTQSYYLQSQEYIINELHRFGGINSIRGFNENSLQGNLFTSLLTEYRYVLAPTIYVHSIIDYGYFQDKSSNLEDNLVGLGFGFGLLTKNGLFNIVYANGSTKNQEIKLSNSIVHISFKTNF